jgi:hypothetical protein
MDKDNRETQSVTHLRGHERVTRLTKHCIKFTRYPPNRVFHHHFILHFLSTMIDIERTSTPPFSLAFNIPQYQAIRHPKEIQAIEVL